MKHPAHLTRFVRGHARGCRCTFCVIASVWPDRALVLAITQPRCEGHAADCECVMCESEKLLESNTEVWEVTK